MRPTTRKASTGNANTSAPGDLGRGDLRTGILLDECGSFNERTYVTDVAALS